MHRAKNCQHKRPQNANIVETREEEETDNEYKVEDFNFVLMTTQNPRKDFIKEMVTKTVIDTACTKTVAGQLWLQNYMKSFDDTLLNQVGISESHKVFKFGDGRKVIATSKAKLPAEIGNTKCFTKAETIQEKIPQYAIIILPDETCNFDNIEQVLIFEEDESDKSKIQKIIKLHKQFSHASRNLEKLLKRTGIPLSNINDIINKVVYIVKRVNGIENQSLDQQ